MLSRDGPWDEHQMVDDGVSGHAVRSMGEMEWDEWVGRGGRCWDATPASQDRTYDICKVTRVPSSPDVSASRDKQEDIGRKEIRTVNDNRKKDTLTTKGNNYRLGQKHVIKPIKSKLTLELT